MTQSSTFQVTAFQKGAFQFGAFQEEGDPIGGGSTHADYQVAVRAFDKLEKERQDAFAAEADRLAKDEAKQRRLNAAALKRVQDNAKRQHAQRLAQSLTEQMKLKMRQQDEEDAILVLFSQPFVH